MGIGERWRGMKKRGRVVGRGGGGLSAREVGGWAGTRGGFLRGRWVGGVSWQGGTIDSFGGRGRAGESEGKGRERGVRAFFDFF